MTAVIAAVRGWLKSSRELLGTDMVGSRGDRDNKGWWTYREGCAKLKMRACRLWSREEFQEAVKPQGLRILIPKA
jgi:hypothetical protein